MKHAIGIFLLVATLTGCSTTKTSTATTDDSLTKPSAQNKSWESREQALNRIHNWQLNGKIAVQSSRDSGSATVDWTQRAKQYNIALMGPFGSHGLRLSGQPGRVTMVTAEGKRVTANNPEQLLAKQWGFHVPVSYLKYWVRGLPVEGIPSNPKFDAAHRISQLSQQGWNVQYLSYTKAAGIDLPNRMSISSPELKVKIVIYDWKVA